MVSDDTILLENALDGLNFSMISEKHEEKNYIEIMIEGTKYTTNQDGVNIVVYDTVLNRVMDTIALSLEDGSISRK